MTRDIYITYSKLFLKPKKTLSSLISLNILIKSIPKIFSGNQSSSFVNFEKVN